QETLERNLAALRRMGEHAYVISRAGDLAEVLYRRGRLQEAADQLQVARAGSSADDVHAGWRWRAVAARLAARNGSFDEGDELSLAALRVLEGSDSLNARATCLLDRGEVLALAQRPREAEEAIRGAISLFELKENEVGADEARALLSETTE